MNIRLTTLPIASAAAGAFASLALAMPGSQEVQLVPVFQQQNACVGSNVELLQWGYSVGPSYSGLPAVLWAGAPFASGAVRGAGLVHAWRFAQVPGNSWYYGWTIGSASPQPGARFGASTASIKRDANGNGALLAVGSPGHRLNETSGAIQNQLSGYAEVFTLNNALSAPATASGVGTLTPPSQPAGGDMFGMTVALASTLPVTPPIIWAFASSPFRDLDGATDAGAIYMFQRDSSTSYPYVGAMQLPDPTTNDRLGRAALAATAQAVFASTDRGTGALAAFAIVDGAPSFDAVIPPPSPDARGFGAALSVDTGLLVVGAPGAYGEAADSGTVSILRDTAPYEVLQVIPSPWPDECAGFGTSVSLRRGVLAVGTAEGADTLASGFVAIYSVDALTGAATLAATLAQPGENGFGSTVSSSGDHVAVGAPGGSAMLGGAVSVLSNYSPHTADLNGDGIVNGADLGKLIAKFTHNIYNGPEDLNNDSQVDGADLAILLGAWGTSG